MNTRIEMIGKSYGRLLVISDTFPKVHKSKNCRQVICKCSCGNPLELIYVAQKLRCGKKVSCGCLSRERSENRMTPIEQLIYGNWMGMQRRVVRRTENGEQCRLFEGWLTFENFCDWSLKNGWQPKYCLCRNGDVGDYVPENVRWDTKASNIVESHAKKWIITYPCGKVKDIISLNQFCTDNDLSHKIMYGLANGTKKSYNNWKCKRG